jgi:hypothetical protein
MRVRSDLYKVLVWQEGCPHATYLPREARKRAERERIAGNSELAARIEEAIDLALKAKCRDVG